MSIKFKIISNREYQKQITLLTTQVKNKIKHHSPQIVKIFAIPRGGLPLGVHLSNYLNIDLITTETEYAKYNPKNVLVVDDLCDSGETLNKFKLSLSCCIFVKPRRIIEPNIYIKEVKNNIWIVFPWEKSTNIKINKLYMENSGD